MASWLRVFEACERISIRTTTMQALRLSGLSPLTLTEHQTSIISRRPLRALLMRISRYGFALHPEDASMFCEPSALMERSVFEMPDCSKSHLGKRFQIGGTP